MAAGQLFLFLVVAEASLELDTVFSTFGDELFVALTSEDFFIVFSLVAGPGLLQDALL